jgi:hypothetical protein
MRPSPFFRRCNTSGVEDGDGEEVDLLLRQLGTDANGKTATQATTASS